MADKIVNAALNGKYQISTWIPTDHIDIKDKYRTKTGLDACNILVVQNALIQTAFDNIEHSSNILTLLRKIPEWKKAAKDWMKSMFDAVQIQEDFDSFYAMGARTTQTCLQFKMNQDRLDVSLKAHLL